MIRALTQIDRAKRCIIICKSQIFIFLKRMISETRQRQIFSQLCKKRCGHLMHVNELKVNWWSFLWFHLKFHFIRIYDCFFNLWLKLSKGVIFSLQSKWMLKSHQVLTDKYIYLATGNLDNKWSLHLASNSSVFEKYRANMRGDS